MNKLIDLLWAVMPTIKFDHKPIGNTVYVELDENRRVEVSFYNTHAVDTYDAIFLKLVSKTNGELDRKVVKFSDIFKCMQDLTHPNKIGKHIWFDNYPPTNGYGWYGKPTAEDIKAIKQTILDYCLMWE